MLRKDMTKKRLLEKIQLAISQDDQEMAVRLLDNYRDITGIDYAKTLDKIMRSKAKPKQKNRRGRGGLR